MSTELKNRRIAIYVPVAVVAAVAGCFWVLYLLKRFAGIDPIVGTKDDPAGLFQLYAALGLTLVGPIVGWFWVRRNLYLLDHGVTVEGRIKNTGLWGSGVSVWNAPSVPVTFAFEVNGKEYSVRKDVPKEIAKNYTPETRVQIRADVKNPQRCLVLD